ncbi:MAG: class I SAM-dependent methyltransferase [Candidatus Woesearchaeota archaeon]
MPNSQTYYDFIAPSYNELYGDEQRRKVEIVRSHLVITPKTRILDVGCGNGISSDFNCYCVGIDPSKELISQAQRRDKNKKHTYKVARAEDIDRFGFRPHEFDYIVCISAVHHIVGLEVFLKKARKYASKFVFSVLKKSPRKQKIITAIRSTMHVYGVVDEGKDVILFCK